MFQSWVKFHDATDQVNENCIGLTKEAILAKIVNYVVVQCGVRGLSPDSIKKTYLPGIASWFEQKRVENLFRAACKERFITQILKGFGRVYAKLNPLSGRIKLAFGMDLALKAVKVMRDSCMFERPGVTKEQMEVLHYRLFTAMAVGIFFMLRRSEHLIGVGKRGPSLLIRRLIVFFDIRGDRIAYSQVGLATKAHKVSLNITFSKTDASGFGRRTSHTRQQGSKEICVVCILERWIQWTRDVYGAGEDMPIYEVPNLPALTMETLHDVMERTVRSLGVTGGGIRATSHSLRYGGATMLAAAGFPQYIIAHYGGWAENSTALKLYARPSDQSLQMVSETMVSITRMNPSKHYIQDLLVRQEQMQKKGGRERSREHR